MACMPGGCEELLGLSDQGARMCERVGKVERGGVHGMAQQRMARQWAMRRVRKERSGAHSGRAVGLRSREGRVRTAAQFAGQGGGEGRRAE